MLRIELKGPPPRTQEPANTGSYTYSLRESYVIPVTDPSSFLRRVIIHGYKVPSKYTNVFVEVCYEQSTTS
jgi:hypothetical protein